jgi:hypothetical protein
VQAQHVSARPPALQCKVLHDWLGLSPSWQAIAVGSCCMESQDDLPSCLLMCDC